jgi:DNA-binding MarR family transcriptional regulator
MGTASDPELLALLKSLRQIARAIDVQSRKLDRQYGLTLPQLIVLRCVGDLGEVTSRAISLAADLSAPTVVGILDKLEAKGLIERYRSVRDRRIVHTRLTTDGQRLLTRAPSPLGDDFAVSFDALAPAGRRNILQTLETITGMVEPITANDRDAS